MDAGVIEVGFDQVAECGGVPELKLVRLLLDDAEDLGGGGADVRRHGQAGEDAALQARDADHEELVEVAGEDGEEVGPLQQRQVGVFGQFEHPGVERQPAQFTVEVALRGQRAVVDPDLVVVVVVQAVGRDDRVRQVALGVHASIQPLPSMNAE